MRSATVRTSPVPHSKACDTFRASDACAVGTGLGSPFLADDFESNSVPQGFIAELLPQHRPVGVEHGFCHPRLRQSGRVHVADNDTAMLAHELRRFLMQKMLPAILRPGVQCSRTAFLSSPLCQGQFRLVPPIEGGHLDPAPVRECSEVFQAKVDRDRGAFLRLSLGHLDRNVEIPTPAGVLGKTGRLYLGVGRDWARKPQPVFTAKHNDHAAHLIDTERASCIERYPAKAAFLARPPGRAMLRDIPGINELPSEPAECVAVQAKLGTATGHQAHEIETARPTSVTALCLSLCRAAVVPGVVDRARHAAQVLGAGLVLDAVSESDNHTRRNTWSEGAMQDIRTGRHVVFNMHVHLVFITKYRRNVLSKLAIRDLTAIFSGVCRDFGAELKECGGEDDRVHSLKGVSSRLLREHRPEISGRYKDGVLWSPSYFAGSCGGAPLSVIAEYIRNQRGAAPPPRPKRRGFRRES